MGAVALYTFSLKPSFRANATVQIERESAEIVDFGSVQRPTTSVDSLNAIYYS